MIERTILTNLVYNESYARKVLPFLRSDYFHNPSERSLYMLVDTFVKKYNAFPSKESLKIDLAGLEGISDDQFKEIEAQIDALNVVERNDEQWLLDQTEKFCQDKAIYNGIMRAIKILDGKEKDVTKGAIPQILQEALAVSFDRHIGHDYLEDWEHRYDFYRLKEARIPFHLALMNKITRGGVAKKSLNVVLAGTGGFKTGFMCDAAAHNLKDGYNVLYITMEMAEMRISERIDANLLDIPMEELETIEREVFEAKMKRVRDKTRGKLIVKEYPTASAGAAHFRFLINELRLKKNFVPDIVYIDYINICCSTRIKMGNNYNSYTYVKAIAEELRGLAVEFNVPIITATQVNREGFGNSDPDLTNTSESFGLPATADLMFALVQTEELEALKQIMVKQLKNRYGPLDILRRFVIGVDKSKMRLYDCEQSAQDDIADDKAIFDTSGFGEEDEQRSKPPSKKSKGGKRRFEGFV